MSEEIRTQDSDGNSRTYDLAVIGAGIAGLNALNSATEYLPKSARCILIDQKDAPGGMWNTTYDYVRLHQPHAMFTVGNMSWNWNKPPGYLAARDQVQAHLASSLGPIGAAVDLETEFGQTVTRCTEIATNSGPRAEIVLQSNCDAADRRSILAKRAIYASGLNYRVAEPMSFSSTNVFSINPQQLPQALNEHREAPVVVVGGGKTGMDTVLAVTGENAARRVILIKGRGTNFLNRTQLLPLGLRRWTSGILPSRIFRKLATGFDGENEDQLMAYLRQHFSTDPHADNELFLYGFQSEDELSRIKSGLDETHTGYLEDVVDTPVGLHLVMRDGARKPISGGAIVVNCTGSFFRSGFMSDPRPILSPKETVLSLTPREAFHFLTSVGGFIATHLFFRGQLRNRGFYTADLEELFAKDRQACTGASAVLAYLNQVIALQTLPMSVLNRCGLDMDRWYPFPRRLAALLEIKMHAHPDIAHCRKTLNRLADRFDIHAKPIT